ncbi:MAG: hypothetical protein LC121_25060 [Anaerolineae bacterium]|nr:hypothetical protein [Anaerolineae bacterium]
MAPDHEFMLPRGRCGVYHLVRAGTVVYIGQSRNLLARIGGHAFTEYDSARFFYCDPDDLDMLELEHIARLRPPMNRQGVTRAYLSGRGPRKNLFCPVSFDGVPA